MAGVSATTMMRSATMAAAQQRDIIQLALGDVKVEDGASRAQYPSVLHLLQLLGALPERLSPRLAEYARTRVRNTRGEVVGEVLPIDA